MNHRTYAMVVVGTLALMILAACGSSDRVVNEDFPTVAAGALPTAAPTEGADTAPTDTPTDTPTDVSPTDVSPTEPPPTDAPPTDVPPTDVPPTEPPPTAPTVAADAAPTDPPPTDPPPTTAPTATPAGPVALAQGQFTRIDEVHQGTGSATIYRLPDGNQVLRFEDFEVTNGPDVFVLLDTAAEPNVATQFGEQINLGMLKGNIGNQNYDIPPETDVSQFKSVVIYCRQYDVVMSLATLQ